MGRVEKIELEVSRLSWEELAHFRAWYARFDAHAWDRQLEQDAAAGKLDDLAGKALRAHAAGATKPL